MSNNLPYSNTYNIEGISNGSTSIELTSGSTTNYTSKNNNSYNITVEGSSGDIWVYNVDGIDYDSGHVHVDILDYVNQISTLSKLAIIFPGPIAFPTSSDSCYLMFDIKIRDFVHDYRCLTPYDYYYTIEGLDFTDPKDNGTLFIVDTMTITFIKPILPYLETLNNGLYKDLTSAYFDITFSPLQTFD